MTPHCLPPAVSSHALVPFRFFDHEGQSEQWDNALSASNAVFTGIFVVEMLLKWMAIGIPLYFQVRLGLNQETGTSLPREFPRPI